MPNLKVLPNDMQGHLDLHERFADKGIGRAGRGEEFEFWNENWYKPHEVVYNRVGHFLLGDDCWWEFKLADGSFRAITADAETFKYDLRMKNAEEKPFSDEDWKAILRLLDRGVLKHTEQFSDEAQRRQTKRMIRDMNVRLHDFKKCIKDKVAAKKAEKNG